MSTPRPSEAAMGLGRMTLLRERDRRKSSEQYEDADNLAQLADWMDEQWAASRAASVSDGWGDDELIVCRPPMADVVPIRSGGGDAA